MERLTLKVAMGVAILATAGVFLTACSGGDDDDDDGGGDVVTQADGGAADFSSCEAPGTTTTTSVGVNFNVIIQPLTGTAPVASNATIAIVNPTTGALTGDSATTNSAGNATIELDENSLFAAKLTKAASGNTVYVDTYQFGLRAPAVGDTAGVVNLRIIPESIYNAFIALIGPSPDDVEGLTQVAGSVSDCSGEEVMNAWIELEGADLCKDSDGAFPCIAYFNGTNPSPNATKTNETGQFIVLGLTPGSVETITVKGIVEEGGDAVTLGTLDVYGVADAVALGGATPQNVE